MKIKSVQELRRTYPDLVKQIEDEAISNKAKIKEIEKILTLEDSAVIKLARCLNNGRR